MKRLILLRHAKSDWSDMALSDHDRPLNKRGRKAAPKMASWLAGRGYLPEVVLCSSSTRTRQTVKRMRNIWSDLPAPVLLEELYHASPDVMRGLVQGLPEHLATAMLVGHQPGLGAFAQEIWDRRSGREDTHLSDHFPTAAAAVFRIDGPWTSLRPRKALLLDFQVPRELMQD